MVKPYLNQVGGKVETDVSMFTGGLNTYVDKAFLEADQLPYVMNMTMKKPPMICTRPSRVSLAQYMEEKVWASNIGDIVDMWSFDENQFFVIVDSGTKRYIRQIYRNGPSYVVTALQLEIPKEDMNYFTLARYSTEDFLYVTGQTYKAKVSIASGNPLATTATLVPDNYYGICCCHKGRLFLGRPDSNIVTFSAAFDYDNFAEPIQYQVVENSQDMVDHEIVYLMDASDYLWNSWSWDEDSEVWVLGEDIAKTSLVIDTTTGLSIPDYSVIAGDFKITNSMGKLVALESFDDKLIIFCEHSMHVMYGDTPDTTKQNQYQLVDLNNNIGCHSYRCVAIGGGRLFWLGDDYEVYEYTGASINIISRPGKTRNSTLSIGGISNIFSAEDGVDYYKKAQMAATSKKLYLDIGIEENQYLFVFDVYNRIWWCEDGDFTSITDYSSNLNSVLLARRNGDIVRSYEASNENGNPLAPQKGVDYLFNFDTNKIEEVNIEYEFHTRVYGADGTDSRKTLSRVWLQARAEANVYINDIWTSHDKWQELLGNELTYDIDKNYKKIGTLRYDIQSIQEQSPSEIYRPDTYEQQVCNVEKMYGERVNAFQVIVKGTGKSKFYLMKREWRSK